MFRITRPLFPSSFPISLSLTLASPPSPFLSPFPSLLSLPISPYFLSPSHFPSSSISLSSFPCLPFTIFSFSPSPPPKKKILSFIFCHEKGLAIKATLCGRLIPRPLSGFLSPAVGSRKLGRSWNGASSDLTASTTLKLNEFGCYEVKIEESEKAGCHWELNPEHLVELPSALPLSYDNRTTTDPHNPLMCTALVLLNASVTYPAATGLMAS